ncbi:MAG: transcription antitermination factor NusB [Deltaproteobacteria bacterium]|nr:transcription antitermination factor NusB [Candidatus Anaeroferrophillus wilburensis]MBN2889164.1 transcription antitermination factor NusB [Deltaproteobacteria bacterium]
MTSNRRKAREFSLQILYMLDIVKAKDCRSAIQAFWDHFGQSYDCLAFANQLAMGVTEHVVEIDQTIGRCSHNWKLSRMSYVDRNILRLAVFELLYCPDIPPKVSINEAIEISKRYGDKDSGAFINGILDQIFRQLQTSEQEVAHQQP